MSNITHRIFSVFIFVFLIISNLLSQNVYNNTSGHRNVEPMLFPWAGGMDAIQFCDIDLNMDGVVDLLAFDRRGNRKICFISNGTVDEIDFVYAPQYADLLPDFKEWVIFADYNMDGKNDIFTYAGYGSMIVYKNISNNELKFELVAYPYLKTLIFDNYVNIYVTNADYPGIADVDNDGDLDILTFGVFGSFIDMHKNMSMEKYGVPDSLDYEHTTYCWGHMAESDESNILYFDTCMPGTYDVTSELTRNDRHTGSTFLMHDFDNNGLIDMLLGDVDYPGLSALYNTGTDDDAYISFADTLFPSGTNNVHLFSMPVAAYRDVNNDDIKDLLVSVFDPGIITSRNKNSNWLYINSGTDNNPVFELQETDFLQSDMIDVGSGAYPVIFDWDGDGLNDLFIGNYGYYKYSYYDNYFLHSVYYSQIAYFKNVGTVQEPVFELWDNDFAGLSSLHSTSLIPSFDDINGDGSTDILVGNSDGGIIYVSYNILDDSFEVITENYMGIDVGEFSAPQLFDLNKNGIKDLIIGEKNGNINYYQNFGSNVSPNFIYVTDSLGKVYVTDQTVSNFGYSTPSFFRDDSQNTGLLVGSDQGIIYYFTEIDNNLDGKFTKSNLDMLLDTNDISYDRGMRTGATICDLYLNGKMEMIVGNYSGGLEYYNGDVNVLYDNIFDINSNKLEIYPNPTSDYIVISLDNILGVAKVNLFNSIGVKIKSQLNKVSSSTLVLNLSDIENGVYLLVTEIGGKVYKNKIIVVK